MMTSKLVPPRSIALVALALGVSGCAADSSTAVDTVPKRSVSGTVTLDGKPLPTGRIQFDPSQGSKGLAAAGEINEGKYSLDVALGKYRVEVFSRPAIVVKPDEVPGPRPKAEPELVPEKYNLKTALEAEVKEGGPDTFDFALTK